MDIFDDYDDELLIRRKRVNDIGEWEYECRYCDLWLPKKKFRGCVDYIDAYGNCLMCSSCRGKKAQQTCKANLKEEVDKIMIKLGYDPYGDEPVYIQFHKRHNLPLP